MVLAGAGVGGGSLNYANTLYEPPRPSTTTRSGRHITDWRAELAPAYEQARRMLGVVANPTMTPADEVMQRVAEDMGVGDTFRRTPVGVFFGGARRTSPTRTSAAPDRPAPAASSAAPA